MKSKLLALLIVGAMLVSPAMSLAKTPQEQASAAPTPEIYTPKFDPFNTKEQMTLSPLFTPDNALYIYSSWLKKANTSIDIQNQYITQFDDSVSWDNDPNPIVREIVNAKNRGVTVRVQVRGDSDSDDVTSYLQSKGISVRWMGDSASNPDGEYLSATHNKLVIIDNKVILISSINFGENAFTNNREAGMVIQNANAASYFTSVFDSDWADGEQPIPIQRVREERPTISRPKQLTGFPSHTNIPRANFTGVYNISLYVNPDNADDVIFKALKSAKKSIYVSMYTISRPDFNNTLIELKKANPSIDIQVLISNRRVGGGENRDTYAAAVSLVENFIPVYNSTKDNDKVNGFYHNKYWIIDGKTTFIYSGNWSPRSVTPPEDSYSSGEPNRDMGVAVYDAPDIADFVKTEVWDKDVAVADAWDLPLGVSQSSFTDGEVVDGTVSLKAAAFGLTNASLSYSFGTVSGTVDSDSMDVEVNTLDLANGVTTFKVTATSDQGTYSDEVKVTVANYAPGENWRVLITELLPNPDVVSDTEGEFIEISNSFPFDVLLTGWQFGTASDLMTFPDDYVIPAYTSVVVARSKAGLQSGYGVDADFEFSFSLANTKGEVILYNAFNEIIDDVAYGTATATDGSETVEAPGAEESIARDPMYLDTNKASDFTLSTPDPKGTVPQQPLATGTETVTGGDSDSLTDIGEVPLSILPVIAAFIALPVLRRRK